MDTFYITMTIVFLIIGISIIRKLNKIIRLLGGKPKKRRRR